MGVWSKLINFYLNLQNNFCNIIDFDEFINVSKTLKQVGHWLKKLTIISVDITGLYNDQFNLKRYCIGWFNLLLMYLAAYLLILSITNQWFFSLIDNIFLPKNFKIFSFYCILISIITTSIRFDLLIAEWNRNIFVFKIFYYIQENIKSKHELTYENYRKFSILAKLLYVICFKMIQPCTTAFASFYYLYIAIMSNRITIELISPFVFYILWQIISTILLSASCGIGVFYYYIFMFKQINAKFEMIYQRSKLFFTVRNQRKLIWLINKHNLVAADIVKFNLIIRRTVLVFFVVIAILLIIPLNIHIKSNDKFEQIFCLSIILIALLYGFCIASSLSTMIRVAHKPYKTVYKILVNQNLNNSKRTFQFKWKVIVLIIIIIMIIISYN